MKVYEKTVRTVIKQVLSLDRNTLDYAIAGVSENKSNATSDSDIGWLKIAIEEEWNKMSEFILKAFKSFRKRVDTIIKKMGVILSKFTILGVFSYFVVYSLKFNSILFYKRVVYYYAKIFLILLPYQIYIYIYIYIERERER